MLDRSVVIGINEYLLSVNDTIISNASCTTNSLALALKVLSDEFSLQKAFFITVHPFTNNQSLMDDPLTCAGRVQRFATRVPVTLGSYIEISAQLGKQATVQLINEAFQSASVNIPTGIVEYCRDPIVSSDIIGNTHSAIIDSLCTKVLGAISPKFWYGTITRRLTPTVSLSMC